MRRIIPVLLCILSALSGCKKVAPPPSPAGPPTPQQAMSRAAEWLARHQLASGGWPELDAPNDPKPGVTAIVLDALSTLPEHLKPPFITSLNRGVNYFMDTRGPDGSLGTTGKETWDYPNYTSALGVLILSARYSVTAPPPETLPHMNSIVTYLKRAQLDEGELWKPEDKEYGGWDYGKPLQRRAWREDLSVTAFVLEALTAAKVPASDPVWTKAKTFLSRVQNIGPDGKPRHAKDDGGFFFSPGRNKNGQIELEDKTLFFPSYGSITADGLRSLLAAGHNKNDPRVQAAYRWIQKNYTLERNPGFPPEDLDQFARGIYYYYLYALAKCLQLYGEETITTSDGKTHHWAEEITRKLLSLQKLDGSCGNASRAMKEHEPIIATSFALATLNLLNRAKK